jgi:hypothetical protein
MKPSQAYTSNVGAERQPNWEWVHDRHNDHGSKKRPAYPWSTGGSPTVVGSGGEFSFSCFEVGSAGLSYAMDDSFSTSSSMDMDVTSTPPQGATPSNARNKRRRTDCFNQLQTSPFVLMTATTEASSTMDCSNMDATREDHVGPDSVEHRPSSSSATIEWWKRPPRPIPHIPTISEEENHGSTDDHRVRMDTDPALPEGDRVLVGTSDKATCHVCQHVFSLPALSTIPNVMPMNALLNYFSPIVKPLHSYSYSSDTMDVTIMSTTTNSAQNHSWNNPSSACHCCDRHCCDHCRQSCEVCQEIFCSFCLVETVGEDGRLLCLDCHRDVER